MIEIARIVLNMASCTVNMNSLSNSGTSGLPISPSASVLNSTYYGDSPADKVFEEIEEWFLLNETPNEQKFI